MAALLSENGTVLTEMVFADEAATDLMEPQGWIYILESLRGINMTARVIVQGRGGSGDRDWEVKGRKEGVKEYP